MTEDEMAGWHHWLDGHEFGWTPGVGDGQGGLACCDSCGRKELDTTEQLNWTELYSNYPNSIFFYLVYLICLYSREKDEWIISKQSTDTQFCKWKWDITASKMHKDQDQVRAISHCYNRTPNFKQTKRRGNLKKSKLRKRNEEICIGVSRLK